VLRPSKAPDSLQPNEWLLIVAKYPGRSQWCLMLLPAPASRPFACCAALSMPEIGSSWALSARAPSSVRRAAGRGVGWHWHRYRPDAVLCMIRVQEGKGGIWNGQFCDFDHWLTQPSCFCLCCFLVELSPHHCCAVPKCALTLRVTHRLTAYHEGGHALVALYTAGADPVHKATIVPRGLALGMVTQLPEEDATSVSKKQVGGGVCVWGGWVGTTVDRSDHLSVRGGLYRCIASCVKRHCWVLCFG
jgi:hypothetical protein